MSTKLDQDAEKKHREPSSKEDIVGIARSIAKIEDHIHMVNMSIQLMTNVKMHREDEVDKKFAKIADTLDTMMAMQHKLLHATNMTRTLQTSPWNIIDSAELQQRAKTWRTEVDEDPLTEKKASNTI